MTFKPFSRVILSAVESPLAAFSATARSLRPAPRGGPILLPSWGVMAGMKAHAPEATTPTAISVNPTSFSGEEVIEETPPCINHGDPRPTNVPAAMTFARSTVGSPRESSDLPGGSGTA